MGCWNETCAISRMSIRAGEAIRLLPIVQNPYHIGEVSGFPVKNGEPLPVALKGNSGCYIGDLWIPLCYPIRGNYNDYGTIEDVDETTPRGKAEMTQFVAAFKEHCVPLEVGENEYHDSKIKDFTLAEILEALQEGRCFMNYKSEIPNKPIRLVPIAWMMIKETVWQSLLATDVKKSGEVWEREGEDDRITVKGIRTSLAKISNKGVTGERREELMQKLENKTITSEETTLLFEALKTSLGNSYYQMRTWHMSPIDAPLFTNDLLDTAAEMEYVHTMMSILRISFAPTTGSGSQCDNIKLWKLVNKNWLSIIAVEMAECLASEKKWRAEEKKMDAEEKAKKAKKKK